MQTIPYIDRFASAAGISREDILGRSRRWSVCTVRQLLWMLLHRQGYTTVQIGDLFGRDHSTVTHGIKCAAEMLSVGDKTAVDIYKKTKHFFTEMSEIKHIIEVAPEKTNELFNAGSYKCPVCGGRGGWRHQTGHDEYEDKACDYCAGTGRVKAIVTVTWIPDGNNSNTGQSV